MNMEKVVLSLNAIPQSIITRTLWMVRIIVHIFVYHSGGSFCCLCVFWGVWERVCVWGGVGGHSMVARFWSRLGHEVDLMNVRVERKGLLVM